MEITQEKMKSIIREDFIMDDDNTLLGFVECENKLGEYQAGETYVIYFAGDETEINCHPIRDMYRHVMEMQAERKRKKTYRINECLVVKGELFPRGFDLHVSEASAEIIVPSDVPGDGEPLYTEEIPLSQRIFRATYVDGNPVHAEDGELIGNEA